MGGKASLFLVLGFSMIFFVMSQNMISFSADMQTNFYGYYNRTVAHNIAVTGANMASSQLFFDKAYMTPYINVSVSGGILNVRIDSLNTYDRKVTSTSNYMGSKDTVIITLTPMNFAQYGNFFTTLGSAYTATGDTFSGPFHVNDYLNVSGKPVFKGRVTTKLGIKKANSSSSPVLLGGYESGVNVPLDFDTSMIRVAAYGSGKIFRDTTNAGKSIDVDLTFNADGTVAYKININKAGWTAVRTVPLTSLSSNGVIFVEKGNAFVRGTLKGRATVVATQQNGGSSVGNIYIASDIRYNTNPLTNPASTDMLGLVGEQSVTLPFLASRGDITIQASIFAQKSGFVVASYDSCSTIHKMNVYGSLIGNTIQPTTNSALTKGYNYIHTYDSRFLQTTPPYFPETRFFKIVSWYE